MKRILLALLFITGAATALQVGETGLNHLRIQPDARIQGIGGVSLGLAENRQSFFANPASLATDGAFLSLSYLPYPTGIHAGSIIFQPHQQNNKFSYSTGAFYMNSGKMLKTGPTNENLGQFSYQLLDIGGSAAYKLAEHISAGANLKFHIATADTSIQLALAGDMGVMVSDLLPGLAMGITLKNAAFEIKPFVEKRSAMPIGIGGGLSYSGIANLLLGLDIIKPLDAPLVVCGGIEYLPVDILALRLGYSTKGNNFKTGEGSDVIAGFSAGIGIQNLAGISLDYAVTPALNLGFFHRISISYLF